MEENILEIVTLNCQRGNRISDLQVYFDGLIHQGAVDFFLLQEVNNLVFHTIKEIVKRNLNYQIVRPIHSKSQKPTEVAIIYKLTYKLNNYEYISYSDFVAKKTNEVGGLIGVFSHPVHGNITVCSSHLHASYFSRARKKEIEYMKMKLLKHTDTLIIYGGDFNYLFPGELNRGNRTLAPEFVHASLYAEHSYDSSLLEPTEFQNKLFKLLARIGLKFLLRLDHIYVSSSEATKYSFTTCVQDVIVSDHRPIRVQCKKH
jgi:endonuclease/exonuclease/phosphatase family metal-dependent hydrolase